MPTPAKLVAGILFAALCWFVAEAIVRYTLEEGVRVGLFRELLAAGGLVVGWRTIGKTATGPVGRGNSIPNVITSGIAAAFILLVMALLLHSFGVMIAESLGGKYTAIGTAASAWMRFFVEDAQLIWNPIVLGLLFGGGAAIGLVAGMVGRRIN
ncbi:hypothetical protein SAMN05444004_110117 [Jannaschia faecimaris]|uniref:Tellurite resistance protein n=1 Tax=Jannaschia faecimaris TaxID=1244108 RepID=A0A1H3S4J5_9RHOB|nr:TrgA family protein [Jannaschia faecimaris]SDZ32717.1 hypothetical protein SAMN05444004_110117 [Jannaschia faecimaris]